MRLEAKQGPRLVFQVGVRRWMHRPVEVENHGSQIRAFHDGGAAKQ